jgi:hypothetical protein
MVFAQSVNRSYNSFCLCGEVQPTYWMLGSVVNVSKPLPTYDRNV